ncbi:MAG: hypothetical protein ACFFEN_01815 [Candidatus Thorarchaeota archaeon]
MVEEKAKEKVSIPNFEVEGKENLYHYLELLLDDTPHLKLSITDKKGKELYSNLLHVEMR